MKLSAKSEYGCLAMLHLADQYDLGQPVQIRKVAAEHDIPWRFLVQILLELKRAGLVVSTRGAAGGYRLADQPDRINLAEIMAALEGTENGPSQPVQVTGLSGALQMAWGKAQKAHREALESMTLADLLTVANDQREPMWYI